MVNSLERFRATLTPNGKRITFTKKENKQFHASSIPKNNIIVLDSFYLLTFYFEKISNWIWRLPFAIKKKKMAPEPAFLMVSAKTKRSLGEKIRERQRNIQPSLSALFFPRWLFCTVSFCWPLTKLLRSRKKVPEISYSNALLCYRE